MYYDVTNYVQHTIERWKTSILRAFLAIFLDQFQWLLGNWNPGPILIMIRIQLNTQYSGDIHIRIFLHMQTICFTN